MPGDAHTVRALVLRAVPYRDADLIVTLYSREHGKLSAIARSARRSRKRFGGGLDLLSVSAMEVKRARGEMWNLLGAEVLDSFIALATDMATLAHSSYALELVRELTVAEQPDPYIFDLLVELWRTLCAVGPSVAVLRSFELHLLEACGLGPVFDRCVACGQVEGLDDGARLDPGRGGMVCSSCMSAARRGGIAAPSASRPIQISAPARVMLVAAQRAESLAAIAGELTATPGEVARAGRDAMLAIILGHVGKPLRSLEFIAKVSGAKRAES